MDGCTLYQQSSVHMELCISVLHTYCKLCKMKKKTRKREKELYCSTESSTELRLPYHDSIIIRLSNYGEVLLK